MIDKKTLFRELDEGKIFPAYLLLGRDTGSKEDFIILLQEKIFRDEEEKKIHTTVYHPDDCSFEAIYSSLMTPSFFDTKNLIIVKDIERIGFISRLLEQVELTGSVLVLTTDKVSYDKSNKKVASAVEKVGRVCKFWEMFESTGIAWVKKELSEMGIRAEDEAVKYIIDISGTGMGELRNQLWLIGNYLSKGDTLTVEKVKEILSVMNRYSVFDLCRAIFVSDAYKICEIYNYLLIQGEDPVKILYFVSLEIKRILKAFAMKLSGMSFQEITGEFNLKKSERERVGFILRNINIRYIRRLYQKLSELDALLKSNPKEISKIYLEGFLLKLSR